MNIRKVSLKISFLSLIFLSFFYHSSAQTWKAVGADEAYNPSLSFTPYTNIAIAPDGTPYIAFNDNANGNRLSVKKFDGSKWLQVGPPGFTEGYYDGFITLAFSPDGTPYVAYVPTIQGQNSTTVVVRKLIGNTWVKVGNFAGSGLYPSLSFNTDGTPYLAFGTAAGLAVEKFTNSNWISIGDTANIAGSLAISVKLISSANGTPYVIYSAAGDNNRASVKKFLAGKWQYIGKAGFTNPGSANVTMAITTDSTIYAAYTDSTNAGKVIVQQFKNGIWSVLGSAAGLSTGASQFVDLQLGPDQSPYLTFSDGGNNKKAIVIKWNGSTWASVGTGSVSLSTASYCHIAIGNNNIPFITYQDSLLSGKQIVKNFVNNQWMDVGMGDATTEGSAKLSLAVTTTGVYYVAFNDTLNNGRVSVKKYASGLWQYVGAPGISNYKAQYLTVATATDGTPYIVYKDTSKDVVTQTYSALVKKFNGTSWTQLGGALTSGFGSGEATMTTAPDGTPIVAFSDNNSGGKLTVEKYSGSAWVILGTASFSDDEVTDINIATDKNGVPYVSYISLTTSQVNLKKFDGSVWVNVGPVNFSPGNVSGLNLAIAPDGTPYVAYYDSQKGKIAVESFTSNNWTFAGGPAVSDSSAIAPKLVFDQTGQLYAAYLQSRSATFAYYAVTKKLYQGSWIDAGNNAIIPYDALDDALAIMPTGDLIYAYLDPQVFVRTKTADSLAAAPVITSCTPNYGSTGTIVTINGFNFTRGSLVKFGNATTDRMNFVSSTQLTATVEEGATGLVSVITLNGTGTYDGFAFTPPPPVIQSFTPLAGAINSAVTIHGKYFSPSITGNTVYFGPVKATVQAATDSSVNVLVPPGATYMPITVTTRQLTAYSSVSFDVTFGHSSSAFSASSFSLKKDFTSLATPSGLLAADIDNDGKADVVASDYNGDMTLYQNLSVTNAINLTGKNYSHNAGYAVSGADFNGDGKLDVVGSNVTTVNIGENSSSPGTLSFSSPEYIQTKNYSFDIGTNDLDGDGRPDIVTANNQAAFITVLRNAGTNLGYTYLQDEIDLPVDAFPTYVALADLNGDGKPEILALIPNNLTFDGTDFIVIFKNTSTPNEVSFTKVAQLSTGKTAGRPVIADLDNDGAPDIIVPNAGSNTISVFRNLSTTGFTFLAGTSLVTGIYPTAVCVADLDGDGSADIAVANQNDNTVSVYKNISSLHNIAFADNIDYKTDTGPDNVIAADLDNDGAPELITANTTANTISVLRNNLSFAPLSLITLGTVSGTINACAGTASTSPNIQQFTVSGSALTANITATAPAGFEVSLAATSGYGGTIVINQSGGAVNNVVVYVRSSGSAAAGSITGNVGLSSIGAVTQNVAVTGTVKALPTVNTITNQAVLNGAATAAVNFTGAGNTFTWVNDTPGIGLAAGGTGNIPSFIAQNTGSSPVKATITVTPLNEVGFAYVSDTRTSNIYIINIATNKVVATVTNIANAQGIAISPDGSKVYLVNYTSSSVVYVINAATNTLVATIPILPRGGLICLSPDGKRAYVNHDDIQNTLTIINTENNTVIGDVQLTDLFYTAQGLAISPDGAKVYVNETDANENGIIKIFDTATSTVNDSIPVSNSTFNIAVSHDGSKLYAFGDSVVVANLNTKTNSKFILSDPNASSISGIVLSPDDSHIYLLNHTLNQVDVFNAANITALPTVISGVGKSTGLSLTPDGAFLYLDGTTGNKIEVYSTITNSMLDSIAVAGDTGVAGNFISPGSGCTGTPVTFTITVNPTSAGSPTITITGTLTALTTTAGTASSSASFTVSGSNLTAGILVTPPAGYEVSTDNTTFSNTVTIAGTGTIAATTVYVRLAASDLAGTYSGNILLTSTGATTVNVPTAQSTVTGTSNTPVISTTGTLNALSGSYGQASAAGSFTVSGSNLSPGVVVTAPPGYEVSTDGTNFGSTVTVNSTGTLSTTTVYVRLAGTAAAGTYTGNVVLTSGGTSVTVATVSSIIAQAVLTVTADDKTRPFGANNPSFTFTYSGFVNDDTPSSLTTLPTAVTTATPASIAGTYPITPGGAAAANYTFKYVSGTLTVTLTNVILTFDPLPAKAYGDPDFDPGASVVTGAAITYTSGNPLVATIVNGMIHIIGVGSAVITASVADTSVKAVTQTLTVNKANQTITFAAIPALMAGTQYDLSGVVASTGLPVSFTIADSAVASVSGQTLHALTAGTTSISALQTGNNNYNPASFTLVFTVDDPAVNALVVHKELSPNGDGINDYLLIDGIQYFPSNTFTVYNRDGVRVAQIEGYDNSGHVFAGRSNFTGALQQAGTYFYVLQYTADASTKKKTGYFVLKYQ